MSNLPLDDIVKIDVNLSPRSAVRKGFNLGLIIGTSDVINVKDRVKLYSGLDSMAEDGFTPDMPEYKAASIYFSQQKKPTRVAIGRHVKMETELKELIELTVTAKADSVDGNFIINIQPETPEAGNKFVYKTAASSITTPEYDKVLTSGWTDVINGESITAAVGHLILVAEVDADNKAKKVGKASIGGDSIPLGLPVPEVMGETLLSALSACRRKNTDWYACLYCGAAKEDILTIAKYVETAKPSSVQFYTIDDNSALTGESDSIFAQLKALNFMRSIGQYSKTPDAAAGIMGYAMGANTKTSRSAYTLMHKPVTGIMPDDLSETQVNYLQKVNGNYYISRGCDGEYSMFENGVMANGTWFDEVINLDMMVNDMQLAILDLLRSRPKIPQTESGTSEIKLAIIPCIKKMRLIGFIAPGIWNGPAIWLTEDYCALETGDMLTDGYLVISEPVDNQTQADRDARIAPPIYTPIKLAGAIHTVLVQIDVNR